MKKHTDETTNDALTYKVDYAPGRNKAGLELLEVVEEMVRDLRDDDSHVCAADEHDGSTHPHSPGECSCVKYDAVIDGIAKAREILG